MAIKNYTTLVEAIRALREKGFTREYKFQEDRLRDLDSDKSYRPEDLKIVEHHRFEGMTNPADMSILFAVECDEGEKGLVVSSYGSYADAKLIEFFDQVKIKEDRGNR